MRKHRGRYGRLPRPCPPRDVRRPPGIRRTPPPRTPTARGYSAPGLRQALDLTLPDLKGAEKRAVLNRLASGSAVGVGLGGAAAGYIVAGPLGAAVGLGAGLYWGGRLVEEGRLYRP